MVRCRSSSERNGPSRGEPGGRGDLAGGASSLGRSRGCGPGAAVLRRGPPPRPEHAAPAFAILASALAVPTLWLLGRNDRTVPTAICVEILDALAKPSITIHLLPTGHGLLVNPTGLLADDDFSPGLPPELVPTIRAWMGANVPGAAG